MITNIESVANWSKIYCPQDYFIKILDVENGEYLGDLTYLIQDLSNQKDLAVHEEYNNYIKQSIMLFVKGKLNSKAQIYGVYWKCESMLTMIWKVVSDNLRNQVFKFGSFMSKLDVEIKNSPMYNDPAIVYLPREVYVECVLKVFYEMFYPTEANINIWKSTVQKTFQQLNNIVSLYLRVFKTKEARIMIFLLNFREKILDSNLFKEERKDIFVKLASQIKDRFEEP